MYRSTVEWIDEYEKKGALWIHDGNPKRPHALLTSGKHSNGFFNSELVMEDPLLLDEASSDLVELLVENGLKIESVDRVVGPAMGAITLAHDVARHIARKSGSICLRGYTEKESDLGEKGMAFKRTRIRATEWILPVEDVISTGGSISLTAIAIAAALGYSAPYVGVLVNRSGASQMGGKKIVALINRNMPMWTVGECPLCKEESEAIRPKGKEEWARLNAQY